LSSFQYLPRQQDLMVRVPYFVNQIFRLTFQLTTYTLFRGPE